jgi:hypothetical protein
MKTTFFFNYENISFQRDEMAEKEKIEDRVLYPVSEFFSKFEKTNNLKSAKGRIIEINFCPFGIARYFPPGWHEKHEVIYLCIRALTSRATYATTTYHELCHADQFYKGKYPPNKIIPNPVEKKKIEAILEIDAYERTIAYASRLPDSMWINMCDKADVFAYFNRMLNEYREDLTKY